MRILFPIRCARAYPILFRNVQVAIICFFLLVSGFCTSTYGQKVSIRGDRQPWYWEGDNEAETHLLEAVDQGDPNKVRELLKNGANPKTRQKGGGGWSNMSALCIAVAHSTSYRNHMGHSMLSPKYEEIVDALVEKGADATECSLQNVGDLKILKLCLAHGANANNGKPLNAALTMWRDDLKYWTEVIGLLLQAGASPNWESPARGSRSLFFPAPVSELPALSTFQDFKPINGYPKPLPQNQSDYEPLIKLLIQYGARVNERWVYLRDRICGYPIADSGSELACWTYYEDARACGPSPQTCSADRVERVDTGVTPLIQASRFGSGLPIVKALLSVGADPMLRDADNCTALDGSATPAIRAALEQALRARTGPSAVLPPSTCKPSQTGGVTFKTGPPSVDKRPTINKIDFLCFKEVVGAHRESAGSSAKTTFGDKQFLIVSVEGSPASLLSEAAAGEITRELLLSISLWRKTCTKCTTGNASVVRVNGSTYVNATFLGAAKSIDYEHADVGGKYLGTNVPTPYSSPLFENRLLTFGSLPQYVKVSETDPFISRLCSVPPDKLPLDLLGLREAFGCGTTSASSSTSLKIRLLNGATRCSPPDKVEDVVGCEVGNLEIELNARQFKYVKHGASELVFGTGADRIDLEAVLLHEMGHWAGISQHLTSPTNIMSQYVQDCKCIDEAVIQELAKSTTLPQPLGNVALRYRRGSRSQ